jgi:Xaa-Pro dipeptidase
MRIASAERVAIPRSEFVARQDRARELAEKHGWAGLAVFGRGGGTYDRHGDLLYLSGHYQAFVHLRDRPPLWSGRSHALLILPVDGDSVLLCSAPELDPDIAVTDVRMASDFTADAADLLRGLGSGGVSGLDVVPTSIGHYLPLDGFAPAEDMLELLRRRKSPREEEVLRRACSIGTEAVDALIDAASPRVTEGEAVAAAARAALAAGAWLYLVALAAGDRASNYTGRPLPGYRPERRFEEGELARLDLILVYEGYYCDFGRSWVVGGPGLNEPADRLIAVLREALESACAAARAGATAGDIVAAGEGALLEGYSTSYPPHWGHGLGLGWEGPWLLPGSREQLETSYALAIETAITSPDGLVAAAEDNVLIAADGCDILSSARWTAR